MQLIYKSLIFKEINMPLLDSFKVDHTRMNAPAVRVAKTMRTPKGDDITVFDMTGLALQDLTVARMLYTQALAQGLGTAIAWPW